MERPRRKKSNLPCLFGGNGDNSNRRTVQPRSPSDGFAEQKLFTFEAGRTSSEQVYGTPMKTLLAKEMLDETSAKKRSPSLIAKLMGLDGLPSPQPIHKQHKRSADNSHKSNGKRNEKPFSYKLDTKTSTEQQHFKDVYEDPEASHVGNHTYSSPEFSARRRSTKQDLGYIQERCDEMLRESIAIKTKLERVDSNSNLMLSYLRQDQQEDKEDYLYPYNQITVLKPSNKVRYRHHGKGLKEDKKTSKYHVPVSHKRNENEHLGYSCHTTSNSRRASRYQFTSNDETDVSPTRIVVLKPNLAKIYGDQLFVHSPEVYGKNTEAREIARQITSEMKEGFGDCNSNISDSGYSESEMMAVSSRCSFDRIDLPRRSSSNMLEYDVSREAKKRMSHRLKTHGYKDVGVVGKSSSTLEEMLSVPNNVVGPVRIDDEYLRRTSRSRSLRNQNQKETDYLEAHGDVKIMIHNESLHRGKNKVVKGNFIQTEDARSRKVRYGVRCHACCSPEIDYVSRERRSNRKLTESYFEDADPDDQELLIPDIQVATKNATSTDEDSSNLQEPSTSISQGTVSIQLSGPELEPESSQGLKEVEVDDVDQHGNILVSDNPTTEDVSSGSDSFENVTSQLNELRKQLLMLKMESGLTYDSPNDEEIEPGSSFTASESDNWECTYVTDFLQNSGFYNDDPHTFMTTWYSVDCPKDLWLFDQLEKIYSQDSTVSRSDRRLFHDRIHEALFVISMNVVSFLWVNPGQRGIQMALTEIGFEDQLQKVLAKQEKEASEDFEEFSIDQDLDWLQPVKEIDDAGKQIAEMLVNELVLEIVTV